MLLHIYSEVSCIIPRIVVFWIKNYWTSVLAVHIACLIYNRVGTVGTSRP